MSDSPKRFVAWSAVSSLPQTKRVSPQEQQEANKLHIDRHGGRLVATLVVPGESRDIVLFEDACRRIKAYAQLRDLIASRAFDVLICFNYSRLGRTKALIETVVELCRRAGVLVYETENPPASLEAPRGSMDELLLGAIKSATAQNEISTMVYRHRSGMLGRAKRGEFPGRPLWGYTYIYDSGHKKVSVDTEVAEIIRLMLVELYLKQGKTPHQIAQELNRRGIRTVTGKRWRKNLITQKLLDVWKYAGFVELNKRGDRPFVRTEGNHPAILTEDEAEAIDAERERRSSMRRPATTHLFSLAVWCARCGERMEWSTVRRQYEKQDGTMSEYIERSARCRTGHERPHIADTKIRIAVEALIEWMQNEANRAGMLMEEPSAIDVSAEVNAIRIRIEQAQEAVRRADDAFVDGTLDHERYRRQLERLHTQIAAHEADIKALQDAEARIQHKAQRGERLSEIATQGFDMLEHDDIELANAWIRRHFRIWVRDNQVRRIDCL